MNERDSDSSNGKCKCGCKCKHVYYFEHLWKYFELHANQRITLFRFYIAFFSFFVAASGFLLLRFDLCGIFAEISAVSLSIIFVVLTIMFHLLDNRNRQLIHYAEDGLELLETKCVSDDPCDKIRIFKKEREERDARIHHTTCFRLIYISAYVFSGLLILGSVIYICCFGGQGSC